MLGKKKEGMRVKNDGKKGILNFLMSPELEFLKSLWGLGTGEE
jgi:hypothetical protein